MSENIYTVLWLLLSGHTALYRSAVTLFCITGFQANYYMQYLAIRHLVSRWNEANADRQINLLLLDSCGNRDLALQLLGTFPSRIFLENDKPVTKDESAAFFSGAGEG